VWTPARSYNLDFSSPPRPGGRRGARSALAPRCCGSTYPPPLQATTQGIPSRRREGTQPANGTPLRTRARPTCGILACTRGGVATSERARSAVAIKRGSARLSDYKHSRSKRARSLERRLMGSAWRGPLKGWSTKRVIQFKTKGEPMSHKGQFHLHSRPRPPIPDPPQNIQPSSEQQRTTPSGPPSSSPTKHVHPGFNHDLDVRQPRKRHRVAKVHEPSSMEHAP
jgi:hypothetical protein